MRQAILRHPFVTGIGDGTLDVDKFRFYVRQDYLYLIDYSRVIALAAARSPDLETMGWFARLLDGTLNVEMDLHRSYCAEFGISNEDLEVTPMAPTTMAYTRFLLNVAHQGTYPELVAAFLPCQWGYWEIGDHLIASGHPSRMRLSTPSGLRCTWTREFKGPGRLGAFAGGPRCLFFGYGRGLPRWRPPT